MQRLWPDPGTVDDVAAFVATEARTPPGRRPWLLVNMIASIDGAITVDDRSGGLGGPADKAMFSALRGVADVVLVGAGTARSEGYGPPRPTEVTRAARLQRGQSAAPRLALVTRSLDLDVSLPLFARAEARPLVVTCAAAPAPRLDAVGAVAEVLIAGDATVDLTEAMAMLHSRGVRTITCEGGPQLNGDLLLADLIDEWALTVAPWLVGGDAGRSATGPQPPAPLAMHLDRLLEGDGLLLSRWLRDR